MEEREVRPGQGRTEIGMVVGLLAVAVMGAEGYDGKTSFVTGCLVAVITAFLLGVIARYFLIALGLGYLVYVFFF